MLRADRYLRAAIALLVLCAAWQWGNAAWIYGKAYLARYWIAQAWQAQLAAGEVSDQHKPWPWADTWPVARLQWLADDERVVRDLYVLAGANGSALAFGPGYLEGTALPGTGASVIGGHRDTHFAFLQQVAEGAQLRVQSASGDWLDYRVSDYWIADSAQAPLLIDRAADALWLVTCYPFESVQPNGSQRFVVLAERSFAF